MKIKLEHVSIIDKKISSFARAERKIFYFFPYRDFWAILYYAVFLYTPVCLGITFMRKVEEH